MKRESIRVKKKGPARQREGYWLVLAWLDSGRVGREMSCRLDSEWRRTNEREPGRKSAREGWGGEESIRTEIKRRQTGRAQQGWAFDNRRRVGGIVSCSDHRGAWQDEQWPDTL